MKYIENFITKIKQTLDKTIEEETSYDYHHWLINLSKMVSSELKELNIDNAEKSIKPDDTLTMVLLFDKGHYSHKTLENKNDLELYKIAKNDKFKTQIYTARGYIERENSFNPKNIYVWTYIVNVPKEIVSNSYIIG